MLQQAEKIGYLTVVFMGDRKWNKETNTRIGKANAVLHNLYCTVVITQEVANTQSCQLLN